MSRIDSYDDLLVWRKSRELVVAVYHSTERFPKYEIFGLTSQVRRAAVSIVANIAEGSARQSSGALANHLDIAIGSSVELHALIRVAEDLGYISGAQSLPLLAKPQEVSKMLKGLHASIRHRLDNR